MKNFSIKLELITQIAVSQFGELTDERLNWKPNPNTWSIAQNLEHLIVVNETYYPVMDSLIAGTYKAPFIAKFGLIASLFGRIVIKAVQPDRQRKMKTFPIWEPSNNEIQGDILIRFEEHQSELMQKIENVKKFAAQGTIISSPANRNIVYKLETAFDIIVSHEERHLEQAKEILLLLQKD